MVLSASYQRTGAPGDVRSSGGRPQAGGIHFRRQAQRTSCKLRGRTACPGADGRWRDSGGENVIISPGPPWFALRLRRAAGPCGRGKPYFENEGENRSHAKAGSLGGRVSGCRVSAGVRPAPACGGRPMFPLRGNIGVVGRISGLLGESLVQRSGKPSLRADSLFFTPGPSLVVHSRFSTLGRAVDGSGLPFLTVQGNFRLPRMTVSQRSGVPGDVRSPADVRKQAGFTPAVKRSRRRAD